MPRTSLADVVSEAEGHLDRRRYREALKIYRRILQSRLADGAGSYTSFDAVVVERVADLATLFGEYTAAEDLIRALTIWLQAAGNQSGADYAWVKLAAVHFARERLTAVREALARPSFVTVPLEEIEATPAGLEQWERSAAIAGDPEERRLLLSRFYLEYSKLLCALGLYVPAGHVARRGRTLAREGSGSDVRQAVPALTLAAAAASLEQGDTAAALRELKVEASRYDERHAADVISKHGTSVGAPWLNPAWSVRRLELTAKALLLEGKLGGAKAALDEALTLCTESGFEGAAVRAATNLAHALILLNQTHVARDLLTDAERRAASIGDDAAAQRAAGLQSLARLRAQSLTDTVAITSSVFELWSDQAPSGGVENTPATLPDPESSSSFLAMFEDRALRFHWYLGRREWNAAAECLEALAARTVTTDSMLIVARLLVMESMLQYYRGEIEQARDGFATAVSTLGELRLLPDRWQAQRFLGWTLKRLGRAEDAQRIISEADQSLDALTHSLAAEDKAAFRLNKWTAEEEFLAGELESLSAIGRASRTSTWLRRAWLALLLRRRLAIFLGQIDRHLGITLGRALTGDLSSPGGHQGRIRLRTPRDTAIIGYFVLPDRLFVACLCGWTVDVAVLPATRVTLRDLVADCHREMVWDASERPSVAMSKLVNALGWPHLLAALPAQVRHLTIIADDSLRGVPFAALECDGTPLIDRFTMTNACAWSASPRRAAAPAATALVAGAGAAASGWPVLPHVSSEIAAVSEWFRERDVEVIRLEEAAATRDAVAASLPLCTHAHVACHGVFRTDRPDQSALVLAGTDALTLRDIADMDLHRVNMAVLSSCWAADSFVLPGRFVLSLPYALWRAGARCVVAPLWEIDDAIALPFMRRFYAMLGSVPARDAMRQVQLECRRKTLPGCDAPHASSAISWAAFQLYGDGRTSATS